MLDAQAENSNLSLSQTLCSWGNVVAMTAVVGAIFNYAMGVVIQNETPASAWVVVGAISGFVGDILAWLHSLPEMHSEEGSRAKACCHRAMLGFFAVKPLSQVTSFCVALFAVKTTVYRDAMLASNVVLFLLSLLGLIGFSGCLTSQKHKGSEMGNRLLGPNKV